MNVTELQKECRIWRISDHLGNEVIIIMEDGDLEFYSPIEIKYGYFESQKKKE